MSEKYCGDMIVNLTKLPVCPDLEPNIKIKRAFVGDQKVILDFVQMIDKRWIYEVEKALLQCPSKCYVATREGKVIGFACYDATARGFFGPIGIDKTERGNRVGAALLIRTLRSMEEYGYGYAIIGWVGNAEFFYRKLVNAEYIKGGELENSVYSNLVSM